MLDASAPTEATPPDPNWTWWNGLTIAEPQRQPRRPSLICAEGLTEFPTLEALAQVLADRLGDRPPILKRSVASYPDYDTFPAFSVYAQAEGAQATAAAVYIGCVAVQKTKAEALEAAIAVAARALPTPRAA